jgi:predicted MFS family arabinose efflux permease
VLLALAAFTLGGVLWAPFIPVVYTVVQGAVTTDEQQPVLTIWTAIILTAAPLGLTLGGPLVTALGATATLWTSAVATLTLGATALASLILARGAAGRPDHRQAGDLQSSGAVTDQAPDP